MKNEENKEVIDLEAYSKENKIVPKNKKYKIKVDRESFVVDVECMTGQEILTLASKTPYTNYQLNQKLRSGVVKKVNYSEKVDFTESGIERFVTLPLDQTEG